MTTVILEGILGKRFGREWKGIHCTTPRKALQVISANVDGLYQFIRSNIEPYAGYAVIVDGEEYDTDRFLLDKRKEPPKTIRFVPLVKGAGGLFKGIFGRIVMTVAICVAVYFTAGAALSEIGEAVAASGVTGASAAASVIAEAGTSATAIGEAMSAAEAAGATMADLSVLETTIGTAIANASTLSGAASMMQAMAVSSLLSTAAAMLTPTPKAGNMEFNSTSSDKTNHYFDGAVNTEKQGVSIPIIYGIVNTGSHPVSVNLYVEETK